MGVRCDVDIFKRTTLAESINREVYGLRYLVHIFLCKLDINFALMSLQLIHLVHNVCQGQLLYDKM